MSEDVLWQGQIGMFKTGETKLISRLTYQNWNYCFISYKNNAFRKIKMNNKTFIQLLPNYINTPKLYSCNYQMHVILLTNSKIWLISVFIFLLNVWIWPLFVKCINIWWLLFYGKRKPMLGTNGSTFQFPVTQNELKVLDWILL